MGGKVVLLTVLYHKTVLLTGKPAQQLAGLECLTLGNRGQVGLLLVDCPYAAQQAPCLLGCNVGVGQFRTS